MKGRKLLTAVVTVLMLCMLWTGTALAASVSGTTPETGQNITVTFSTNAAGLSAGISTTGLEFVSSEGFGNAKNLLILAPISGGSINYTYRVVARPGETVSVTLSDVVETDGETDMPQPSVSWSASVGGTDAPPMITPIPEPPASPSPSPTETDSEPDQPGPTESPAPTDAPMNNGASITQKPAGTPSPTPERHPDPYPKTGDGSVELWVLVVAGAACAVIAVIAGRKFLHSR